MPHFSIRNQTCVDPSCQNGRVVVHSLKQRRFRCTACRRTWVAHAKSLHYRLRSEPKRVDYALKKLAEGYSIRRVAELCRASPTTVHRWKLRKLRENRPTNPKSYECFQSF